MWIISGVLSIVFTILNYLFTIKKNPSAQWASIYALSFTSLTLLALYGLVLDWVNKEDWSALIDVVPSMLTFITGYVIIMIFANVLAFVLRNRSK